MRVNVFTTATGSAHPPATGPANRPATGPAHRPATAGGPLTFPPTIWMMGEIR